MLSAWYACLCLDASTRRTAIYLGILEVLADETSPRSLVRAAFGELARLDVWMRVHAFPHVCAWAREAPADDRALAEVREYLDGLFGLLPEQLQKDFSGLHGVIGGLGDAARTGKMVREWAAAARAGGRSNRPRGGEYLDLPDELPVVLVLGLAVQLKGIIDQGEEHVALDLLLEAALRGLHGRLPLLLALRIAESRLRRGDIVGLRELVSIVPMGEVVASPDLLEVVVGALFAGQKVEVLLAESRSLGAFALFVGKTSAQTNTVGRLGVGQGERAVWATPLVLWVGALWELAAQTDPAACAQAFGDVWGLQGMYAGVRVRAKPMYPPTQSHADMLLPLLSLRFPAHEKELHRTLSSATARELEASAWSIHSPWIDLGHAEAASRSRIAYPQAETPLTVFRLTIAALVAATCATRVAAREDRLPLVALVVHTWSVLEVHHPMSLDPFDPDGDAGPVGLSAPLRSLALHVQRRLARLGCGEYELPAPDDFMALLGAGGARPAPQIRTFREEIVPSVLVRWLQRGFGLAVPNHLPERWLPWLARVVEAYIDGCVTRQRDLPERTAEADLLRRFVDTEHHEEQERDDKWWEPRDGFLHHRCLLFRPPSTAQRWRRLDDKQLDATGRLVRAIALAAEQPMQWRVLLDEQVTLHLRDPYVRLRLIELLESELLPAEAQMDIVCALLECGSLYDLRRLLQTIFSESEGAWIRRTTTQELVQQMSLGPLVRARDAGEHAHGDRSARNPWQARQDQLRTELLTEVIERIAWFAAGTEVGHELGLLLRARRRVDAHIQGDLEVRDGRRAIRIDGGRVPEHRVEAVVVDASTGRGFALAPEPRQVAVGTCVAGRLRRRQGSSSALELTIEDDPEPAWELAVWEPSAFHALQDRTREDEVVACRGADGRWWPLEIEVVSLLLTGKKDAIWALTWIGHEGWDGSTGERFGVQPGVTVVLPEEVWVEGDFAQLTQRLAERDATGLIVSVKVRREMEGGRERLRVALCATHSGWDAPFDARNAAWGAEFERDMLVTARRGETGWWVQTTDAARDRGFPAQVEVANGRWRDDEVELVVTQWDAVGQRQARLTCTGLREYRLTVAEGERQAFLRQWLELGRRDRLQLSRVGGGDRCYYTRSNVPLFLDIDSLSMEPMRQGQSFLVQGRRVWVRAQSWEDDKTKHAIDPVVLPSAIREAGTGVGIVFQVSEQSHRCEVLWLGLGELPVSFNAPVKVRQGLRLRVTVSGGVWSLAIGRHTVKARALWRMVEVPALGTRIRIVGRGRRTGQDTWFAEVRPGELCELPPDVFGRLFVQGPHGRLANAPEPGCTGTLHPVPVSFELPDGARVVPTRVTFGTQSWHGFCDEQARGGVVRISRATLVFGESFVDDGETFVDVYRRFDVEAEVVRRPEAADSYRRPVIAPHQRPVVARLGHAAIAVEHKLRWEEYLAHPRNLSATRIGSGDEIRLGALMVPDGPEGWTPMAMLVEGPWLPWDAKEPLQVRVFLDTSDVPRASCRMVPPVDVEEYRQKCCENVALDCDYEPARPLRYIDIAPGLVKEEREHVFEWAPGQTLRTPESGLRFGGKPFKRAKLALFHGDKIQTIRFVADAEHGGVLLDVQGAGFVMADGTSLYRQATKWHLLHVLNLVVDGGRVEIASVVGFQERHEDSQKTTFKQSGAVLRDRSAARIAARMTSGATMVLGRLDTRQFRETAGKRVIFDHVRMSFAAADGAAPLNPGKGDEGPDGTDDGDLVFMESAGIGRPSNDFGLRMNPIEGLDGRDIGVEFRRPILLLRREFSIREDVLARLLAAGGEDAFAGRWIPVRLRRGVGENVSCTLVESSPRHQQRRNLPLRREAEFRSRVAASEAPMFGVVLEHSDNGLVLELRPTVFVKVENR